MSAKVLVLGVGNTLLSDEGVGVHTVRQLAAQHGDLGWLCDGAPLRQAIIQISRSLK